MKNEIRVNHIYKIDTTKSTKQNFANIGTSWIADAKNCAVGWTDFECKGANGVTLEVIPRLEAVI